MPYRLQNYGIKPNSKIGQQLTRYYDHCIYNRDFTSDTMKGKISTINRFVRWSKLKNVNKLSTELVLEFVENLKKTGLKPRSINDYVKHIKAMATYFRDYEDYMVPRFIERKVVKLHESDPNKRAFTREQVNEALHYADRETWLMIKIMFDCGLRIKELRDIEIKDINGSKISILGKGRKRRTVILSDIAVQRLNDYVKREKITRFLWPSKVRKGCPKTRQTIRYMLRKPFEAMNIDHFCPHELRYSYATDLKRLGASNRSIQQGLGHSSEKITEHYLKDLDDDTLNDLYRLKYSVNDENLY